MLAVFMVRTPFPMGNILRTCRRCSVPIFFQKMISNFHFNLLFECLQHILNFSLAWKFLLATESNVSKKQRYNKALARRFTPLINHIVPTILLIGNASNFLAWKYNICFQVTFTRKGQKKNKTPKIKSPGARGDTGPPREF